MASNKSVFNKATFNETGLGKTVLDKTGGLTKSVLNKAGLTKSGLNTSVLVKPVPNLDGQRAVVTGGSRGLGLLIADELIQRGCRVLICARDREELLRARSQLRRSGGEVEIAVCDLAGPAGVQDLADAARNQLGGVDILVNNAGLIQVGPLAAAHEQDFTAALDTMFLAPMRLTLELLPAMRERGDGRIVNISSIGGRIAPPHLLPYSAAKFALAGFSQGLRAELTGTGVSVTTVFPGLMRTGSHTAARFSGDAHGEYAWFSTAASLPLLSMDARRAARSVVDAAARRQPELVLTAAAKLAVRVQGVAPATTVRALGLAGRLLPGPDGGRPGRRGAHAVPGAQVARHAAGRIVRALTAREDRAARALNEPTP